MPAVDPAKPPKGRANYPTNGATFVPWVDARYCTSPGTHSYVKKAFARTSTGWVEFWNNRPVTTTGDGSSSSYDRITVTGTVDPNNFSATPRFYYKKSSESTYTAGGELTVLTGDTAQSVGSITITGLVENTVYNYYLSATSPAGTSDTPTVKDVTTQVDCRTVANGGAGWGSSSVVTENDPCGTCGGRTKTVITYTKAGCANSPYTDTIYGTCTEVACGCSTTPTPTNGWSATQTRTRTVSCGGTCNGQDQYQEFRTKAGCTEVIITDWTNTGSCTDRMESYPCVLAYSGITMTIDSLYGGNSRWVIASTSERAPGQAAWLDAGSRCYCNAYRPTCTYATEYTLVRCPVTGTIYWSSQLCG